MALAVAAAVSWGGTLRAEDPRNQARALAEQGFDDFEAKRYEEALAKFTQAEKLFHAPPHKLFIARSHARLGQLLRAKTSYEELLAEKLGPKAPKEFVSAQQEGREELEAVEKRTPRLRIQVTGPGAKLVKVELDGVELDGLRLGGPIPLDPGSHRVQATPLAGTGAVAESRSVDLKEGATTAIELEIGTRERGWNAPALAFLGAGAAGLIAGGVLGGLHLSEVAYLDGACPQGACPASEAKRLDDANALGLGSTASFAAGGGLFALGIVFLAVPPFREQKPALFAVRPSWVPSGGGVSVAGAF